MGGPWDKPSTDSESDKTRWLSKGNPEKNAPYKWFYLSQVYHSFSEPAHVTIYMLSFSLLPSTLFHYCPSACINSFIQSQKSRALSLATGPWGLVPGIQSFLCLSLTSISVQGTKILLLAAAGWVAWNQKVHYFIQWTTLHSAKATTFKNHHFRVGENEFSDYKEFICFNENINVFPCPTFYFIQIWMNSKISNFSHVV